MARLPLQTLPALRAVAQLGNLRAAAQSLHLTHSAVSQQIRLLEEQIGFALFERRGRRIVLNAAGQALVAATEAALATLDEGLRTAAAVAGGDEQRLRVTVLPSFAQRWLLPRMASWRRRHPALAMEVDATQRLVDLQREGFHAAVRSGRGGWPGMSEVRLIDSALIAVGAPAAAERLRGRGDAGLAEEPLLGEAALWSRWFESAGVSAKPRPVADFNDAGLMLQATEHDIGIALARELLAVDALASGTLRRLSPRAIHAPDASAYYLVYPAALADWPPVHALRDWLLGELAASEQALAGAGALPGAGALAGAGAGALAGASASAAPEPPPGPINPPGTAPAGPTGSRSPAASGAAARPRGRTRAR